MKTLIFSFNYFDRISFAIAYKPRSTKKENFSLEIKFTGEATRLTKTLKSTISLLRGAALRLIV